MKFGNALCNAFFLEGLLAHGLCPVWFAGSEWFPFSAEHHTGAPCAGFHLSTVPPALFNLVRGHC